MYLASMFKTAGSVMQGESKVSTHPVKYIIVDRNRKNETIHNLKRIPFCDYYNIVHFPILDFCCAAQSFKYKDLLSETLFLMYS